MEFRELKRSVEKIEMSDEMRDRIIRNCRLSELHEMEKITMKTATKFMKNLRSYSDTGRKTPGSSRIYSSRKPQERRSSADSS